MAEAIYEDLTSRGLAVGEREDVIEEWVKLMVPLWTSHSIPVPQGYVCTDDDDVAAQFIAKYPQLQALIDLCKAEALRRWPGATFQYEVHSDPEGCHCCSEGQHLTLEIQTGLDFYGPDGSYPEGSPYSAASDAWQDWQYGEFCDDAGTRSPYLLLVERLGEVAYLFRADLQSKQDDKNGEE
jgi:hypothetical protein